MAKNKIKIESGLWVDLYELTMAQVYYKYKPDQKATFELFIRSEKRPFYVAYGITEALQYLEKVRFSKDDVDYLKGLGLFDEGFLKVLKKFRFKGDVWAVEEPEIIFSQEPILRVTADLVSAQIVESALLNIINLYTTLATKSLRVILAAKARKVFDFSLRRTQGIEASNAAAKASFVAGCAGTSNVLAASLYNIKPVGTMAHSYVMSFSSELESFRVYSRVFPKKTILLVDTYNSKKGIHRAIKVAKEMKKSGHKLLGLRLDSGDLVELAKYARKELDAESLIDTIIFGSGNLDEYKIQELVEKKAPIDAFGVGTNMGTSSDLPFSDVVYKIVEITDSKGKVKPVMKYSKDKATYPLAKQVFRKYAAGKIMREDVIGAAFEKSSGRPLLKQAVQDGKVLAKYEDTAVHKNRLREKTECLPAGLKKIIAKPDYKVSISGRLKKITEKARANIEKEAEAKHRVFFDIDTQHDFVDKNGALYAQGAHKLKSTWKKLTQYAVKNGILIISSQDAHKKKDPEFKKFGSHCVKGSRGYKKIPQTEIQPRAVLESKEKSIEELFRIKDEASQIILEKPVLDVFSNPNTSKLIDIIQPEEVYVYGVTTEFCVKSAVLNLKKMVDEVFVVEDAVKEISPGAKEAAFSEFKKRGVKFKKSRDIIKE